MHFRCFWPEVRGRLKSVNCVSHAAHTCQHRPCVVVSLVEQRVDMGSSLVLGESILQTATPRERETVSILGGRGRSYRDRPAETINGSGILPRSQ